MKTNTLKLEPQRDCHEPKAKLVTVTPEMASEWLANHQATEIRRP